VTAVVARPAPPATAGDRALFAGTGLLLRAALHRDRRRLAVWVAALGGLVVYAAVALRLVYPTAADRAARGSVVDTPAGILLSGPGYGLGDYTLGAMLANELSTAVLVAAAVMAVQLVVRQTRAEEEDGRAELVLSAAVGRGAPLAAALGCAALAELAVAVVVAAGLVAAGSLPAVDSAALAAGWGLTGLLFGTAAAVCAQVFEHARAATGTALAVLGGAVLARGAGDVLHPRGSWLSWLSPLAWAQQTRPFVDLRPWPLALTVAVTGALVALAVRLGAARDVGAGILAPARGPASASPRLAGPAALLARLQRGSLTGWAAALLVVGALYGSFAGSVTAMVAGNPTLARALGGAVGSGAVGSTVTDGYLATVGRLQALLAAAVAVASVLRLRGEETAGRVELLLSTAVDRRRLLAAALGTAAAAGTLLLVLAGAAGGVAAALTTGDGSLLGRSLAADLVQVPAVLVVAAAAAAVVGLLPRWSPAAWALFAWSAVDGLFGPLLRLPGWALRLSPFGWVPRVPAEPLPAASPAGLVVVAALLGLAAVAGFRRRDVPA
jgi:ABC-2 type transport system permease protein